MLAPPASSLPLLPRPLLPLLLLLAPPPLHEDDPKRPAPKTTRPGLRLLSPLKKELGNSRKVQWAGPPKPLQKLPRPSPHLQPEPGNLLSSGKWVEEAKHGIYTAKCLPCSAISGSIKIVIIVGVSIVIIAIIVPTNRTCSITIK